MRVYCICTELANNIRFTHGTSGACRHNKCVYFSSLFDFFFFCIRFPRPLKPYYVVLKLSHSLYRERNGKKNELYSVQVHVMYNKRPVNTQTTPFFFRLHRRLHTIIYYYYNYSFIRLRVCERVKRFVCSHKLTKKRLLNLDGEKINKTLHWV